MAEYINKSKAISYLNDIRYTYAPMRDGFDLAQKKYEAFSEAIEAIDSLPTADVAPVVRCRDCANYVESEEVNGEKMCVRDADWSTEDGCYYGFTEYPQPDWFCADGKKREES